MVDRENTYGERVSRLVSWGHWFAFFNIVAAMLIGTRYITQSPWPETFLGQLYLTVSWVGHFGFLVFALYLLVLFPLTFILPSRKLFRLAAVCYATIGLTILLVDTQAYQSINLHLTPVVWELLFSDSKSAVSSDLQHLFVVLPLIFMLELGLSEWVWHKQRRLSQKRIGRPIAAVFFLCFIASHLIYIWADAYFYNPVTSQRSNFPLSYPMTAKSFMEKHGLLDRDEYMKRLEENKNHNVDLMRYPLDKLTFNRRGDRLNILLVSINNLRADRVSDKYMPNLSAFADNNLKFNNHYSSSNDSFGVFGLFYGLPSSYAPSIKAQGSEPVLLSTLEDRGYHFGLFSGDNFEDELYSEVIFRHLHLAKQLEQRTSTAADQGIKQWQNWLDKEDETPWFTFLEITTVENFDSYTQQHKGLSASEKFKAGYNEAVQAADFNVKQILDTLKTHQLLDSTVVIFTSNHGTEFNETNTNSWGSNSNYSRYQLQVPMIIHWPGKMSAQFNHMTSHLDLSVTLMQDLLGVSSSPTDFSSGRNLFDESRRKWILAGDSRDIALISANETTVVDKFGNYKLYDKNYKRLRNESPKLPILMQGLTELQRFYTRSHN